MTTPERIAELGLQKMIYHRLSYRASGHASPKFATTGVQSGVVDLGFDRLVTQRLSHCALGVMSGSCRGGNHQDGPAYKDGKRVRKHRIHSRWSKKSIRHDILRYHRLFNRLDELRYTAMDFQAVIEDDSERCVLFLDPPYWGGRLYQHSFTSHDHERLAELLKKTKHAWVLTYGSQDEIQRMYDSATIQPIRLQNRFTNSYRTDLIITRPGQGWSNIRAGGS